MHRLATIHERDPAATNQPTTSRQSLWQYAPLTTVSEMHKHSVTVLSAVV